MIHQTTWTIRHNFFVSVIFNAKRARLSLVPAAQIWWFVASASLRDSKLNLLRFWNIVEQNNRTFKSSNDLSGLFRSCLYIADKESFESKRPRSWMVDTHTESVHTHLRTDKLYLWAAECASASVFQPISVQGRSVVIELNMIWRGLAGWLAGLYGYTLFNGDQARTRLFIHLSRTLNISQLAPAGLLSNATSFRGERSPRMTSSTLECVLSDLGNRQ